MLHYFAKSFFAPVLVSPRLLKTNDVDIYVTNDRFVPIIDAKLTVDVFNWSSLVPIQSKTYSADVGPLNTRKQAAFTLWNVNNKDQLLLRFSLKVEGASLSPNNYLFPVPLKSIKGLKKPNINVSIQPEQKKNSIWKIFVFILLQILLVADNSAKDRCKIYRAK